MGVPRFSGVSSSKAYGEARSNMIMDAYGLRLHYLEVRFGQMGWQV